MRILISGAGIGGLTLASAMQSESITIVERRPQASGIGAGLLLHDEALAALQIAGGKATGRRFTQIGLGLADGRFLRPLKKTGLAIKRPDLHSALLSRCKDVDLRTSTIVDSFAEDELGVDVRLSDGSEMRVDVLVGADGLGSSIRNIHGASTRRCYSGTTCWRAISRVDCAIDEPFEIWGRGLRIGIVPLDVGTYLYLTESAPPDKPRVPAPIDRFSHFGHGARSLIESVPAMDWVHHDLEELDDHCWGTARVPLLGDAAHAFTPNLGEGAAQAILDAVHLARHLQNSEPYPGTRRRKNARIANLSRWVGRVGQAKGGFGIVRDIFLTPFARRSPYVG